MLRKIRPKNRQRWSTDWQISDAPLAFFDLETTGLHPERGQKITEIALIDSGGIRFRHADSQVPLAGELEAKLLAQLNRFLADIIVVGHNVLFDLRFLTERAIRQGLERPKTGFIDTMALAAKVLDDPPAHLDLSSVAQHLGLEIPKQRHQAIPDARLAREVFAALVDKYQISTLHDAGVRRFELHGT